MTHKDFTKELKELDINLKEFAELANLKYSGVSKFGKQNPVPAWVPSWLRLYRENKDIAYIKKEIKALSERM